MEGGQTLLWVHIWPQTESQVVGSSTQEKLSRPCGPTFVVVAGCLLAVVAACLLAVVALLQEVLIRSIRYSLPVCSLAPAPPRTKQECGHGPTG